jgi:LmbE family N-acetylglucosaminyl deacetylase
MTDTQTAIFLSPHFDDIALSCGGMAARLARVGARCIGLTVFAAPSREGDVLSPFAQEQHLMWESGAGQGGAGINEVRREEERQALKLLGLQPVWLDFQDAPYRRGLAGEHLYNSNEELFGRVAQEERDILVPRIAGEIRRVASEAGARGRVRVFAPLGVGNHVDHQIVFWAARLLGPRYGVLFYEDYPYAAKDDALVARLRSLGVPSTPPLQNPKSKHPTSTVFGTNPKSRIMPISEVIGVKVAAIARYKSQLGGLFGGSEAMPGAVRAYAQSVAGDPAGRQYAERFWQLPAVWVVVTC